MLCARQGGECGSGGIEPPILNLLITLDWNSEEGCSLLMKEKYLSLTGNWTKISLFPNPQASKQTAWEVYLKGIGKQIPIITVFMRTATVLWIPTLSHILCL